MAQRKEASKKCVKCLVVKPLSDFYTTEKKAYSYCRLCWTTKLNLERKEKREKEVKSRGGKCFCCGLHLMEFLRYYFRYKTVLCFNCYYGKSQYKVCPHNWLIPTKDDIEDLLLRLIKRQ